MYALGNSMHYYSVTHYLSPYDERMMLLESGMFHTLGFPANLSWDAREDIDDDLKGFHSKRASPTRHRTISTSTPAAICSKSG